jgi:hypothetical protein
LEAVATPVTGSRRERVVAMLAAEARAFERVIGDAPEQWWAVFMPIWPDLETAAEHLPTDPETTSPAGVPVHEARR